MKGEEWGTSAAGHLLAHVGDMQDAVAVKTSTKALAAWIWKSSSVLSLHF